MKKSQLFKISWDIELKKKKIEGEKKKKEIKRKEIKKKKRKCQSNRDPESALA